MKNRNGQVLETPGRHLATATCHEVTMPDPPISSRDPHRICSHQHDDPRDDGCWDLPMSAWNEWLADAKVTNTAVGDFIRDAKADELMPKNIFSHAQLRNYLLSQNACEEALHAANLAWRRYQRYKQRVTTQRNSQ